MLILHLLLCSSPVLMRALTEKKRKNNREVVLLLNRSFHSPILHPIPLGATEMCKAREDVPGSWERHRRHRHRYPKTTPAQTWACALKTVLVSVGPLATQAAIQLSRAAPPDRFSISRTATRALSISQEPTRLPISSPLPG